MYSGEIQHGAVRVTTELPKDQLINSENGRQYKHDSKERSHQQDVGGNSLRRTTATKLHVEQNQWTDVYAKLTIPTLEKQDYTNANMWWRKFVQNIKVTKDWDLWKMTNNKEKLPQHRDQLETEIKDIFLWAIGENAIKEMTKTVREREPENQAHYRYTNYTHCFDYISHRREMFNRAEPISATSNGKTESPRRMSGNEY